MVGCNAGNLFSVKESRSCRWLCISYEYNHGTHTMCDKSNVFSGCSGNLGKLFFPFSGTHLKLFRKEWPICLLGDFYRQEKIGVTSEIRVIIYSWKCLELLRVLSNTYKTTVLPRFMIVIMCPRNFAAPKTILAKLVRVAFLTSISETGEVLFMTRVTHDGMGHWKVTHMYALCFFMWKLDNRKFSESHSILYFKKKFQ